MEVFILPIFAGLLGQFLKLIIQSSKQKFNVKHLLDYSGMPSGHSAMVVSLTTILLLKEGINSPLFGFSFVFATLIIRDAVGLRRYLGQHGKTLNILIKDLKDDEVLEYTYPHLLEKIGHTVPQVLAGSILGALVSLIGNYLINN